MTSYLFIVFICQLLAVNVYILCKDKLYGWTRLGLWSFLLNVLRRVLAYRANISWVRSLCTIHLCTLFDYKTWPVNDCDMRQTTRQPHISAIVEAQHFSLFGHITQMPRCQEDLNSFPFGELEETTRMPSYYMDEDYPVRREIQIQ